jgi:hypothetical protein
MAMGAHIEANGANESFVNSGTIQGKTLAFTADERLVSDVRPADPHALLRNVQALQVRGFMLTSAVSVLGMI